jgi:peptidoglycan/xylan/chitin deacetylase (PgdA/CDA1 family)
MSSEKQRDELLKSKEKLEELLRLPIKYFAYSHGQYDKNTLAILKELQCYSFAFGVSALPTNFYTKRWKYHLPRLNCEDGKICFRIENKGDRVKLKIN